MNDIVTKIGYRDEPKRRALGFLGPGEPPRAVRRLAAGAFRPLAARAAALLLEPHAGIGGSREKIGESHPVVYFKFCFERNPARSRETPLAEPRQRRDCPTSTRYLVEMDRRGILSTSTPTPSTAIVVVDRCLSTRRCRSSLEGHNEAAGLCRTPGCYRTQSAMCILTSTVATKGVYSDWGRRFVTRSLRSRNPGIRLRVLMLSRQRGLGNHPAGEVSAPQRGVRLDSHATGCVLPARRRAKPTETGCGASLLTYWA